MKQIITTILNNNNIAEFKFSFIELETFLTEFSAYNLGLTSSFLPKCQIQYRLSKPNKEFADWHTEPDPYGRLIIYVSGKYKITVGKPNNSISKVFGSGDILFFNDQEGYGHITEVVEEGVTILCKFIEPVTICQHKGLTAQR